MNNKRPMTFWFFILVLHFTCEDVSLIYSENKKWVRHQPKFVSNHLEYLWSLSHLIKGWTVLSSQQITLVYIHLVVQPFPEIWLVSYLRVIEHYSLPKQSIMHDKNKPKWLNEILGLRRQLNEVKKRLNN